MILPIEKKHTGQALYHLLGDSTLQALDRYILTFAKDKYAVLRTLQQHTKNLFEHYLLSDSLIFLRELLDLGRQYKAIKDEIFSQFLSPESIVKSAPLIRDIALTRLQASYLLYRKHSESKYLDAALRAMQDSKNLILQSQLHERNVKKIFQLPDSLLRREEELYLKINDLAAESKVAENPGLERQRLDLEKEYFDIRRRIFLQSSRYDQLMDTELPLVADIQKNLDEHTIILDYFLDRGKLFILSISKKSRDLIQQPFGKSGISKLRDFISWAQQDVMDSGPSKIRHGYELFELLIPTNIPHEITRLIVLPDNDLSTVPFDILMTREPDDNTIFSELPYLLKKYEVIYLSSLQSDSLATGMDIEKAVAFAPFVPGVNPDLIDLPPPKAYRSGDSDHG